MRVAIADPPYLGCCKLYDHYHPTDDGSYGACWDDVDAHRRLLCDLYANFDGFAYFLSSPSLVPILQMWVPPDDCRIMAWVKPFAAFKANVPVAYAWEPVIVKPCRKQVVAGRMVMRDWIAEPITMERGLTGAKPERVSMWLFEMLGMEHDDEFVDLFPGSGAISAAHAKWCGQFDLVSVSPWSNQRETNREREAVRREVSYLLASHRLDAPAREAVEQPTGDEQ